MLSIWGSVWAGEGDLVGGPPKGSPFPAPKQRGW